MLESSDEPSLLDRIRSSARRSKAHAWRNPLGAGDQPPALPLTTISPASGGNKPVHDKLSAAKDASDRTDTTLTEGKTGDGVADNTSSQPPPPAPPPAEEGHGETSSTIEEAEKPNIGVRFYHVLKETLLSSYLNILLIFVPVAIAVQAAGVNPTIVFAMNAIAIVPLAGLLSHATESVAAEMGDTIGALMNVTFGNAVELIIL